MTLPADSPLHFPLHMLFSLALTLLLGRPIRYLLDSIEARVEIPKPQRIPQEQWQQLIGVRHYLGGRWIGLLERFIFFVSIIMEIPELIFAWLTFKVASKWEVWNNVYKLPSKFPNATELESLVARSRWGARIFQRFVVGTAVNLSASIIGVSIYHLLLIYKIFI